jgi:hypothetical protein
MKMQSLSQQHKCFCSIFEAGGLHFYKIYPVRSQIRMTSEIRVQITVFVRLENFCEIQALHANTILSILISKIILMDKKRVHFTLPENRRAGVVTIDY